MKTILLTGSTGFIGKNLKEYLILKENYKLLTPTHEQLDLMDSSAVSKYLCAQGGIDVVIHSANMNTLVYREYDMLNSSLRMFYNFEKNKDYFGKMYYFGSGAEYDRRKLAARVREEFYGTYIPTDAYGFAKYIMGKEAQKDNNIYELVLFGVYGKYEEWQRRFISNNIVRSLKGMPMTLSQNAMFDYLYVDDLCKIIEWFIEHEPKHKRYNVCTSQPVALLDLAHMINKVSGLDREIRVGKEGWQTEYTGDNSRLLKEMGDFRFIDKQKSIEKLLNYYATRIEKFDLKTNIDGII